MIDLHMPRAIAAHTGESSEAAQVMVGGAITDSAHTPEPRVRAFPSCGSSDASTRTTQRYTHVSKRALGQLRSPLDDLSVPDETQTG